MRFADITGQEDLKRHLVQSVDAGRVSHAQLFTGQAGAGALALAVAYVQYLCCHHRHDGDSCGECPDCRQIAALAHPDLKSSGSQFYIVWGKPMDDGELDRAQERVRAGTNGRVTIPDSLRACYATLGGTPHLDGQYTVFGRVTEGLEVVDAIQRAETDSLDRPLADVRILRAEVVREPEVKR